MNSEHYPPPRIIIFIQQGRIKFPKQEAGLRMLGNCRGGGRRSWCGWPAPLWPQRPRAGSLPTCSLQPPLLCGDTLLGESVLPEKETTPFQSFEECRAVVSSEPQRCLHLGPFQERRSTERKLPSSLSSPPAAAGCIRLKGQDSLLL